MHSWRQYRGRSVSREIYKAAFSGLPGSWVPLFLPSALKAAGWGGHSLRHRRLQQGREGAGKGTKYPPLPKRLPSAPLGALPPHSSARLGRPPRNQKHTFLGFLGFGVHGARVTAAGRPPLKLHSDRPQVHCDANPQHDAK